MKKMTHRPCNLFKFSSNIRDVIIEDEVSFLLNHVAVQGQNKCKFI